MEGGKKFTIIFNSKSKGSAIPAVMKIAAEYRHTIEEDGFCHVFFEGWDPRLEELLSLVDGLKGTLLIDPENHQFKSKQSYDLSLRWDEEKKARERNKASEQAKKNFKKELANLQKEKSRLEKEIEKKKIAYGKALIEISRNREVFIVLLVVQGVVALPFILGIVFFFKDRDSQFFLTISTGIVLPILSALIALFGNFKYIDWKTAREDVARLKKEYNDAVDQMKEAVNEFTPVLSPDNQFPDNLGQILLSGLLVKMENVRAVLGLDQPIFDAAIVDMAIEFGFWIDGDNLVFGEGNHTSFIDRVKQIHERYALIGKVADAKTGSGRVPLKDIQEITRLQAAALDDQIVDWAIQFGLKIDGDEIVLDPLNVAGFIDVLQAFSP